MYWSNMSEEEEIIDLDDIKLQPTSFIKKKLEDKVEPVFFETDEDRIKGFVDDLEYS